LQKSLVIVESPAKARTIEGFLGDRYVVKASIGHIRDLPSNAEEIPEAYKGTEAGRLGIDVEKDFEPIYVVPADKKRVVSELRAALKGAGEVLLATDEDREGEAISWHVLEVLQPKVPVKRMVFHEITRGAIQDALSHPRDIDLKLVEAQEGRRILDRLVGYETSPILWRKIMPKLSAGRVQSVAARLVVERERARMAFRSADFWDIEATLAAQGTEFHALLRELNGKRVAQGRDFDAATGKLSANSDALVLDEAGARGLAQRLEGASFQVLSVESKAFAERPQAPFTTSTLQQEAGRKLRFGSAKAMRVAQRLYERGYITYMRTDSTNLSDQAVQAAREQIAQLYGKEYLPEAPRTYRGKVKNAQEAHEAIRPAGEHIRSPEEVRSELDADEQRLYELVWIRTVACQMADARARRVSLKLEARSTSGEKAGFSASGKTYEFLGFRRAYVEDRDEGAAVEEAEREAVIPSLAQGDSARCVGLKPDGHTTQPPGRFTEASLVKELEERGIGRPSTYAAVIQTIQDRGYVWKKGTALVPTWTAFAVVGLLEQHFGHLVDYGFTARMEEDLDQIASGEGESKRWLRDFYFSSNPPGLRELVADERVAGIDPRAVNTISIGQDAKGEQIAVRVGRYGPYLERGADRASVPDGVAPDELSIARAEQILAQGREGGRELGSDPESGLAVKLLTGRFGPYVQLGEFEQGSKEKPKRASLFKSMRPEALTLEQALQLLALPRVVGVDAQGEAVTAQNGRFGPYIRRGTDSRSLPSEDALFTVTLDEALAIFAQPKRGRGQVAKPPLAELGPNPENGAMVKLLDGRHGPYVSDGTTNASLPRDKEPSTLTLDEALALLRERIARGGGRAKAGRRGAPKAATKKAAPKKAAASKKVAGKKASAKSAAASEGGAESATKTTKTARKAPAKSAAAKSRAPGAATEAGASESAPG